MFICYLKSLSHHWMMDDVVWTYPLLRNALYSVYGIIFHTYLIANVDENSQKSKYTVHYLGAPSREWPPLFWKLPVLLILRAEYTHQVSLIKLLIGLIKYVFSWHPVSFSRNANVHESSRSCFYLFICVLGLLEKSLSKKCAFLRPGKTVQVNQT